MGRMKFSEDDVRRVLEHLKQKAGIFEEVREKFNIGGELGLACLPECHDFTDGFIDEIILKNSRPHIDFYYPTEKPGRERAELGEVPRHRIIVSPVFNENNRAYLISVYFSPGISENLHKGMPLDEGFFRAPDQVLKGIFGHECSEYLWHFKWETIPEKILRALGKKFSLFYERSKTYPNAVRRALEEQCPADFLTSAFGFREEMISCLEFEKDRHLEMEDFFLNYYKRPQICAAEFQARIDFIEFAMRK